MSKLLIVDDEINIRELIKKYATFEGHEVTDAVNGLDAIEKCEKNDFDLVVMDVMMPELDGFSAVKEIRKTKNIPIIMLSARGEEYDRLHGFDLGIDDYVVKPFSPKELMMRINAIMNRYHANNASMPTNEYVCGNLRIELDARIVTIDGVKIEMTPKEYDLLIYLITNENTVVRREELLSKIWGYNFFGDDRTLDTHMKLLRRKLGSYGKNIVTLRGVGYRFDK